MINQPIIHNNNSINITLPDTKVFKREIYQRVIDNVLEKDNNQLITNHDIYTIFYDFIISNGLNINDNKNANINKLTIDKISKSYNYIPLLCKDIKQMLDENRYEYKPSKLAGAKSGYYAKKK